MKNSLNKLYRSQKVIKLCSLQLFNLKSCQAKTMFEFLNFEIQILQTMSDGEAPQIKIVDLKSYKT
jgi:hypothetical protein